MTPIEKLVIAWIAFCSFGAIVLTCADKWSAKHDGWRVRESTLLWMAAFGGSVFMFLTMLLIRHKTKHKKFMMGLPVIIFIQCLVITAYIFFLRPLWISA